MRQLAPTMQMICAHPSHPAHRRPASTLTLHRSPPTPCPVSATPNRRRRRGTAWKRWVRRRHEAPTLRGAFPTCFRVTRAPPGRIRSREAPPLRLHLRYINLCLIISRALISSRRGGYMVHAASASAPRAATPPSPRRFLIDSPAIRIARNSPENNTLIFSNRSKIASLPAPFARALRSKNHDSRGRYHASRLTNHRSLLTSHAFLIATFSGLFVAQGILPVLLGVALARCDSSSSRPCGFSCLGWDGCATVGF